MNIPTIAQVRKAIREEAPPICPERKLHTPVPEGYYAKIDWANEKSKTHEQTQCPGCGLWVIWVPKSIDSSETDKS